jgi:integrase
VKAPPRFLTPAELEALAGACDDDLPVRVLAMTGIRFGELTALRVGRVDLLRRRLHIEESASEVGGRLVWSTPKSHAARAVPLPRSLVDRLAERCAGRAEDELVFTAPEGGPLRLGNWRRRVFDPACRAVGLQGVTPHDLRHAYASLAIASGATVKDVQRALGHASAAMTLDLYAVLWEDGLDDVADRLDALVTRSLPEGRVVGIERPGRKTRTGR